MNLGDGLQDLRLRLEQRRQEGPRSSPTGAGRLFAVSQRGHGRSARFWQAGSARSQRQAHRRHALVQRPRLRLGQRRQERPGHGYGRRGQEVASTTTGRTSTPTPLKTGVLFYQEYRHRRRARSWPARSGSPLARKASRDRLPRPNLGSFVDWDGDGKKDLIGCEFEHIVRLYRTPAPAARTGAGVRDSGVEIVSRDRA